MNIVATLRREERKLEKRLVKVRATLLGLRTAMQVLAGRNNKSPKAKRRLSAAARARISAAQKRRWAKVKAGAKKAVS